MSRDVSHSNPATQAGFTQIPNAIMFRRDLKPTSKLVYGYLKHLAWREGESGSVMPAREQIAEDLGLSVDTVRACIRELQAAPTLAGDKGERSEKLVVSTRRGQGQTNAYSIYEPRMEGGKTTQSRDGKTREQEVGKSENSHSLRTELRREANASRKVVAKSPGVIEGRKRNPAFDALVEATRSDADLEGGKIAKALNLIRKAYERDTGATLPSLLDDPAWGRFAEEIRLRAYRYRERWPNMELTPTALSSHWSRVMTERPGKASLPAQLADHAKQLREEGR